MAAAAKAAADAAKSTNGDSYIGSLISLITKSEMRYEGFMFHLNAQETTIGIRNVKSLGTEGRKKDGQQVPPSDKIYDYIFFRGSDIKDLQVISSPPVQSTSSIPDDPAIIQTHISLPTTAPVSFTSSGAVQVSNFSSNAQPGVSNPSSQGNHSSYLSMENPGYWASSLPPLPVNIDRPAMPTYCPSYLGSSSGISQFQQHRFPPPPHGLVVSHPLQQQSSPYMNAPSPTYLSNILETPRSLLTPASTSSLNFLPPMASSSTAQSNIGLFPSPNFNFSPSLLSNIISGSPAALAVDTSSRVMSSPATSFNVHSSGPPVSEAARSVLGPDLCYPSMFLSPKSSIETPNVSTEKTPWSPLLPSPLSQHSLTELPSSKSLQTINNGKGLVQASTSEPLASESLRTKEPLQQEVKQPAQMHEAASSSPYHSKHHSLGIGDESNGATFRTQYGSGSHTKARGHTVVTQFTEDFDFEAMNEKFNKEEVWGLLGRTTKAGSEDRYGDGEEIRDDTQEEAGDLGNKPVYCKDDFFDTISSNTLDRQSGIGKVKFSERRRIDTETFGEIHKHQRGRGIQGPRRAGGSQGAYRGRGYNYAGGRGYDNAGRRGYDNAGGRGYDNAGGRGYNNAGGRGFDNTGGMGYDNAGGRGYNNAGGRGYDNTGGTGYDNTGGTGYDNAGRRGFDNAGGRGFDNAGGRGYDNTGGRGYDNNTGGRGYDNTGGRGFDNTNGRGFDNTGGRGRGRSGKAVWSPVT